MAIEIDAIEAVQKTAATATMAGAGTAAGSGGLLFFSLSSENWQIIGIAGGLAIGLLGLLIDAGIKIYFGIRDRRERCEREEKP